MTDYTELLDCSGLNCPLPILKTKKAVDKLESGQVLKMVSTDPGSCNDVEAWSNRTKNPLIDSGKEGDKYVFYIQKK